MSYTSETIRQIWNDETGERIEIAPDRDGLGLVEIRFVTDDGVVGQSITGKAEQMRLVALALLDSLSEPDQSQGGDSR